MKLSLCCYGLDIIDYKCSYKMPMKVGLVGLSARVWVQLPLSGTNLVGDLSVH